MSISSIAVGKLSAQSEDRIKLKYLITLLIAVGTAAVFLFFPIITKSDAKYDIYTAINGLQMVLCLFTGGKIITTHPDIGRIEFTVPFSVNLLFALALLPLLALIFGSVYSLVKNKEIPVLNWVGAGAAVYLLIMYIIFILPVPVATLDYFGENKLFYQVFQVNPTVIILAALLGISFIVCKGVTRRNLVLIRKFMPFYIMALIPLALIFLFTVYPVILQIVMTFKEYKLSTGVWGSEWVGFANFAEMFGDPQIVYVLFNTVLISIFKIVVSIICPLIVAFFLFDIASNKYRKVVQTVIYLPHFFSWVVIYGISYAFLNEEGIINTLMNTFGLNQINFLTSESLFIPIQLLTFGWKEIGWGTIIYFAALTGIDMSMFEAAKVDGAGPMKRLIHITIPSIMPVIVFTTVLALGNVLKTAGGEQLLLFYNLAVEKQALVIDTWLYFKGISELKYGLGSAMLFFQSFIGIIFVVASNWFSKKFTDRAIW